MKFEIKKKSNLHLTLCWDKLAEQQRWRAGCGFYPQTKVNMAAKQKKT